MSQRINLQYSIKLEELESEVVRLLEKTYCKLRGASDTLSAFHESGVSALTVNSLNTIDDIRLSLADIDHTFSDVHSMISGYIQYVTAPTTRQPQDDSPEQDVDELQKKLNKFKNSLTSLENENSNQAPTSTNQDATGTAE